MTISSSLLKQMIKENLITREDLWQFIQVHKDKTKDEFGSWLLGQEVRRTDKMIMAIDLWNDMVQQKLEQQDEERWIRKWKLPKSNPIPPEYLTFFEDVEQLEQKLAGLPEMSLEATQYFPLILSRPICIENELLKWSDPEKWHWLVDNEHITEEIGLLQKDLRLLKEALETTRRTGEKPVISR